MGAGAGGDGGAGAASSDGGAGSGTGGGFEGAGGALEGGDDCAGSCGALGPRACPSAASCLSFPLRSPRRSRSFGGSSSMAESDSVPARDSSSGNAARTPTAAMPASTARASCSLRAVTRAPRRLFRRRAHPSRGLRRESRGVGNARRTVSNSAASSAGAGRSPGSIARDAMIGCAIAGGTASSIGRGSSTI